MQNDELRRVVRLAGYVYIPIALLILFVFALVEYQAMKIERAKQVKVAPAGISATSSESAVFPPQ